MDRSGLCHFYREEIDLFNFVGIVLLDMPIYIFSEQFSSPTFLIFPSWPVAKTGIVSIMNRKLLSDSVLFKKIFLLEALQTW